jgi:opacity protein-like surface antigen
MISLRKVLLIGAALVAGSVSAASAADLGGYRGGSMKDGGYAPVAQTASPAWYFRMDTGFARHDAPYMLEDGVARLTSTTMDKTWTLGGGVGYYFNKHIRGDLTYDHRFKSDVSGYRYDASQNDGTGLATDCSAVVDGIQSSCHGTRAFGLKSDVFLANLYYDIDCRCGFTPYVGAGLGFVRHRTTGGTVTGLDANDQVVRNIGTVDGSSSTHVAGALMAGVSFQLRERMNIDAGYRFLYLGETATGAVRDNVGGLMVAPDPSVEQIHAHEFRIGMRYDLR